MVECMKLPKTIWIVEGRQGEYEDYTEWAVAFYYEEKQAEEHADKAQKRSREICEAISECEACRILADPTCPNHKSIKNKWDQRDSICIDFSDVEYIVYPVRIGGLAGGNK